MAARLLSDGSGACQLSTKDLNERWESFLMDLMNAGYQRRLPGTQAVRGNGTAGDSPYTAAVMG